MTSRKCTISNIPKLTYTVIILDKQFAECDDEFDVECDDNSDDFDNNYIEESIITLL